MLHPETCELSFYAWGQARGRRCTPGDEGVRGPGQLRAQALERSLLERQLLVVTPHPLELRRGLVTKARASPPRYHRTCAEPRQGMEALVDRLQPAGLYHEIVAERAERRHGVVDLGTRGVERVARHGEGGVERARSAKIRAARPRAVAADVPSPSSSPSASARPATRRSAC